MKTCQQCKSSFQVAPEDIDFYKKIDVPKPTLCPDCRMQRRMAFRNERNLYKRKCDFSGAEIVSIYSPESRHKIYEQSIWWSDKWDVMGYSRNFDFNRPFFEQFDDLMLDVPRSSLQNRANDNSDYCNDTSNMKDSYLCFNAEGAENIYYVNIGGWAKSCMDLFWCTQCELCYECTKVHESYHSFWCFNGKSLSDCYFCSECQSCKNCFGCIGLRQKEYCIYNKQFSKEEYKQFINDFHFSYQEIEKAKKQLADLWLEVPHRALNIINCEDCSGDYIADSKNCVNCFDIIASENCKYVWDGMLNNGYDCYNTGLDANYLYECVGVYRNNNSKFSHKCGMSGSDLLYCDHCSGCENCFGCIGLYKKKYCILNKQYKKEEYEDLKKKIIEHMKKTKEYGEFFPAQLSPFGYNETMALEYFPLEKEEAIKQKFNWNDYVKPIVKGGKTIPANRLPNAIDKIPDDILGWAIECKKDKKLFKIIPQELKFYREQGLPIPHLCPDCRHYDRKARINPRKLYNRKCDKCDVDIKTSFAPDRPEIVCCEACYLSDVY